MSHFVKHLSRDKQLKKAIAKIGIIELRKRDKVYLRLCESIVSQQLSVKAADTIYGRFLDLFGGREPSPEEILETTVEQLRSAGLSNAKSPIPPARGSV